MEELIRIGVVSAVKPSTRQAKVFFPAMNNMASDWMYVLNHGAPWMPKINERVIVLYLPGINTDGFILGGVLNETAENVQIQEIRSQLAEASEKIEQVGGYVERFYPPGYIVSSVGPDSPNGYLSGQWVHWDDVVSSITGETTHQWKRVALPTFEVVDGNLHVIWPEYTADARLDVMTFSIDTNGNLNMNNPGEFDGAQFSVVDGQLVATML